MREGLGASAQRPIAIFDEFLDMPRFGGEAYERTLATYFREKYSARPPGVIVAHGKESLRFLLHVRADLFPRVPIVHSAVLESFLRSIPPLPDDVVGIPLEYEVFRTVEQALKWHPRATRLVLVTGASDWDREWEGRLRAEVPRFKDRARAEFLAGLPTGELSNCLGALGPDTVVFTPGFFQDGAGRAFTPREAVGVVAAASTAPVYGPYDTLIDSGIVGGFMPDFLALGRLARQSVDALFEGTPRATLGQPRIAPVTLNVDWRQVRRWGIDEKAIPENTVVHFRSPTFFEQHPVMIFTVAAVMLLQSLLIGGLVVERRRRRAAERAVATQRFELAHASRLAVAGELTASIAHEINQPLGAILSNADAADLILDLGGDRREELRAILADIRRDDVRASEVIRRLRTMLAKHEVERLPLDVNEALAEVTSALAAESSRRGLTLELRPAPEAAVIAGDRVQVQQVFFNLLLNSMDALADAPDDRRTIGASVESDPGRVVVTVRDRGPGIPPEHLPKLFDSFFSTKRRGMGLGLSIARTLAEAHGGRIRVESRPGEGAAFHVELPAVAGGDVPSPESA
jgi:signal transduction histidine kinase